MAHLPLVAYIVWIIGVNQKHMKRACIVGDQLHKQKFDLQIMNNVMYNKRVCMCPLGNLVILIMIKSIMQIDFSDDRRHH